MIDLRQTEEYAKYLRKLGWIAERIDNVNYAIKKLPLIGSIIKLQRPEKLDKKVFKRLNDLSEKYRAFHIIIEPKDETYNPQLTTYNFRLSNSQSLPSKTIHIDLKKSEKQLLKEMHYKTRYNIKKSQNSNLKIQNSKDIETFAKFWQECALKQRGMFLSLKKEILALFAAFKKKSDLLFAYYKDELVAGVFLVYSNEVAYYMYAAASDVGKKLFAPTLIAWEAIKLAKKKHYKIFDFEGIYDERFPLPSWKGFSRFKKSFGGSEVEYPGDFVKFHLPF